MKELLPSWNNGTAKHTIIEFVERVTDQDSLHFVTKEERIAVFDSDGTLWCEKPMPLELGFAVQELDKMAKEDPKLRDQQPWKAAYTKDYDWLDHAINRHYAGDDNLVKILATGLSKAFDGLDTQDYSHAADQFAAKSQHPTLGRRLKDCGYTPMIELMQYLEANGFTNYIASGGNRDFMRGFALNVFGIPPERIIGSSNELGYIDGNIIYQAKPDIFDNGPAKPIQIWSHIGRKPLIACGNSNGDVPMLEFATGLRLLIMHDDKQREFNYIAGSEKALERDWTIVSIKDDWSRVFSG